MRLEMGTFPVTDIVFGSQTRWNDGVLEVNEAEILEAVRADRRIAKVELELAKPGESVRIWPARDVVEPRVKVEGPGVTYPGICGRPITTVGQGRTHRMSGISIVEVSETPWQESGMTPISSAEGQPGWLPGHHSCPIDSPPSLQGGGLGG